MGILNKKLLETRRYIFPKKNLEYYFKNKFKGDEVEGTIFYEIYYSPLGFKVIKATFPGKNWKFHTNWTDNEVIFKFGFIK